MAHSAVGRHPASAVCPSVYMPACNYYVLMAGCVHDNIPIGIHIQLLASIYIAMCVLWSVMLLGGGCTGNFCCVDGVFHSEQVPPGTLM